MLTISLDDTIEHELNQLAEKTGKPVTQFVRDLIIEYLEDAHDALLGDAAMDRLMRGESSTIPYSEVKRRLHELDN